eukprot:180217_1
MAVVMFSLLLWTLTSSLPASFHNLPDSRLTLFQGNIPCETNISRGLHAMYDFEAWKIKIPSDMHCYVTVNLVGGAVIGIFNSHGAVINNYKTKNVLLSGEKDAAPYYIQLKAYAAPYYIHLKCNEECHLLKSRKLQSYDSDDDCVCIGQQGPAGKDG